MRTNRLFVQSWQGSQTHHLCLAETQRQPEVWNRLQWEKQHFRCALIGSDWHRAAGAGHLVRLVRATYLAFSGWFKVGSRGKNRECGSPHCSGLFAVDVLVWLLSTWLELPQLQRLKVRVVLSHVYVLAIVYLYIQVLSIHDLDITWIFSPLLIGPINID